MGGGVGRRAVWSCSAAGVYIVATGDRLRRSFSAEVAVWDGEPSSTPELLAAPAAPAKTSWAKAHAGGGLAVRRGRALNVGRALGDRLHSARFGALSLNRPEEAGRWEADSPWVWVCSGGKRDDTCASERRWRSDGAQ